MIKLSMLWGAVMIPSYIIAAVVAQASHTDILTVYSIGIFGGVVIAAMRLQRIEDKMNNLQCQQKQGETCSWLKKMLEKALDRK